jgi:predicted nucleic acid-binding protein
LIVLDASLMVAWLIGDREIQAVRESPVALRDVPVIVPAHWTIEISNALCKYLRAGRMSVADLNALLDDFDVIQIRIDQPIEPEEMGPLAHFALTHDLTTYDAAYLQLALRHQATLATLDKAMRVAASKLNIPLLPA